MRYNIEVDEIKNREDVMNVTESVADGQVIVSFFRFAIVRGKAMQ